MSQPGKPGFSVTRVHPFASPIDHGPLTPDELAALEKARLWEAIQIARMYRREHVVAVRWSYKLLPLVHGPHWLIDAVLGGRQGETHDLWHMTWRVSCSDPTAKPVCVASREVSDLFLLLASDPNWHVVDG